MSLTFRPFEPSDAAACAHMVVDSAVGRRYGFTDEAMTKTLTDARAAGGDLFVAEDGGPLGFAWVDPRGAFAAPYLRLLAVDPAARSSGVGAALLAEFERRTEAVGRPWCLLVSDFNAGAQEFYSRHGYMKRGTLPDFARPGITEILMVKRRPPEPM